MPGTFAGISSWVTHHHAAAAGIGLGGAGGLALYARHKANAAGTTAASTTAATDSTGTAQTYGGAGYYDSTSTDLYNAITPQIQALQAQIAGLQPGPVSTTSTTATTTGTPAASSYVGAQWQAGQDVTIGGTPGVADPWSVLAKKILSSNTYNNPYNIAVATKALKAANPGLASKFGTAVPNTNKLVIPKIPGLNAPGSIPAADKP